MKQYCKRPLEELDNDGGHYSRHIDAMTTENLESKSDIAAELAWRDYQIAQRDHMIDRLKNRLKQFALPTQPNDSTLSQEVSDLLENVVAGVLQSGNEWPAGSCKIKANRIVQTLRDRGHLTELPISELTMRLIEESNCLTDPSIDRYVHKNYLGNLCTCLDCVSKRTKC